jgi:hypothetical protein
MKFKLDAGLQKLISHKRVARYAAMWILGNADGKLPEPRLTGRRLWVKHYPANRPSVVI